MASSGTKQNVTELPGDIWLVRPCEIYLDEYTDCKSIKGRFHQYYTNGSYSDCERWQKDHKNCLKFRNNGDIPAVETIIASEKERRDQRLKGAQQNDVWEYRTTPPADWNADLPEWTSKRQHSVLAQAQRQRETTGTLSEPEMGRTCTVS